MKFSSRIFILLPAALIFIACQVFTPIQTPQISPTVKAENFRPKPSFTPSATPTIYPTRTPTPTAYIPTPTATVAASLTPTPTAIPLDTQLRIFENLWQIVKDTYVYPDFNGVDWSAVHQDFKAKIQSGLTNEQFYSGISELIFSLGDDHSYFLDPLQVAEQKDEFEGTRDYVGIGVLITSVPDRQRAVILAVTPHGPADIAGLKPRDSILAVDGIPILDEEGYLRDIVRGPEGSEISVTVQAPGDQPHQVHLVRQKITADYPVAYQVITTPDGKRFGYIFLLTFMADTVDEQVASALKDMTTEAPLDGLILDNRMNVGGSSLVFEPALSYFAGGTLGHFIGRTSSKPLKIRLHDINGSSEVPLVVLVGSGTASFGEIFSGILQDIGRAYIIGTTTNGNVEILWGYDFEDGSELWLANETFQPVNHPQANWEETGIIPDLTVQGEFDQYSFEDDPVILASVQYLLGQ